MADKIKVGFIGTGGIANHHLQRIAKFPDADIAAHYDVDKARAEKASNQYGGRAFDNLDALLDVRGLKAVWIAVPPFAHAENEAKVIAAGIPMFVEKPIATSLETAEKIARKIKAKKLLAAVGYNWRYLKATDDLRQRLDPKDIIGASGWWVGGRPGVWWWRRMEKSGGQIVEQTTHIVDIANYIIASEPVSVYAAGRRLTHYVEPDHDVHDISSVTITYRNGVIANIWSSDVLTDRAARVGIEFFAPGRKYELVSGGMLKVSQKGYEEIPGGNDAYSDEDRAFLDAVRTGDRSKVRATYETALVTHRVTMAANRSLASGRVERA